MNIIKKIIPISVCIIISSVSYIHGQAIKNQGNMGAVRIPNKENKPKSPEELQREIEILKASLEQLSQKVENIEKATDPVYSLNIHGIFDVNISNYRNTPNIFDLGSFELQLDHSFKNHFQVAAALAFKNRGAELGVGFIDYHIFGGAISPRGRLFDQKGFHIQVGKFDVPFGNDWQYLDAASRISVTPPITTDEIMNGGYNDIGLRLLGNFVWVNFTLYVVRGIDAAYTWSGNSLGGRISFAPFNNPYTLKSKSVSTLEFGFSYIHDFDKAGRTTEMIYGADIESKAGPVILRGEYIRRDKTTVGIVQDGGHGNIGLDLETLSPAPLIIFFRYDYYRITRYKFIKSENFIHRVTGGLNVNISHISFIKFEFTRFLNYYKSYMTEEYFNKNLFYLQCVITF